MNANVDVPTLSYVRLSGEIADKKILNRLGAVFPNASIAHAYASTEAGIGFVVNDRMEGFPPAVIGTSDLGVAIKVVDGTLRIRSPLTAIDYMGHDLPPLRDPDGYIDTGDIVERRDDRYFFVGRKQGIINVGGLKVHPEEVESVINQHPAVQMSLVKARKSSFTGSIIVADVVTKTCGGATDQETLCSEILRKCRETLPQHKVPAVIRVVRTIEIAESGKLVRANA
jgi:acyl-coenzyme A synthetase/AMP-(fatty) acid ligase